MKKIPRVVIDNNIFVSGLLKSKNCSRILEMFLNSKFDLVTSDELVNELIDILNQPKLSSVFFRQDINELLELLSKDAELVVPESKISVCRDKKDNIVLECALSGDVDFIVTGDKDLLELKKFQNIPILTPKKFLKYFE